MAATVRLIQLRREPLARGAYANLVAHNAVAIEEADRHR